ncbi:hypothetical protein BE17_42030 [Sorangium cellulosum]|uniref:Uncharacterized protein n=1 Tax=Sorangium cellulosum TaxID=56 RepID=A0A150RQJ4_SORCE|nr:hypothetical protein BE17_42030 [Sorangium cellulosum]
MLDEFERALLAQRARRRNSTSSCGAPTTDTRAPGAGAAGARPSATTPRSRRAPIVASSSTTARSVPFIVA